MHYMAQRGVIHKACGIFSFLLYVSVNGCTPCVSKLASFRGFLTDSKNKKLRLEQISYREGVFSDLKKKQTKQYYPLRGYNRILY